MNKVYSLLILFSAVFLFDACKEKNVVPPAPVNEFQAGLNEQDTLTMLKICDDCMELLKSGDVETVVSQLHEYDDSTQTVTPISDDAANSFRRRLKIFPVKDFHRVSYKFFEEGLNDVKYEVIFAEEEHPEQNGVPKTFFMFNPVKVNGQWYLCVKQGDQRVNG